MRTGRRRKSIVVEGGVANIALDAIYPTLTGNPSTLDGNHTYKLTFTLPASSNPPLPAMEIYPPMVTDDNGTGNPKGFWSIHVYATDPTEGAAPFIAQTSVLNTHFSTADTAVVSVDADGTGGTTMTVNAPNWGKLVASTPILFGGDTSAYGLLPDTVYYVADDPTPSSDQTTYTFHVATQWLQELSPGNVPIQGPGGSPKGIVQLLSPGGAAALEYGMVKPVTQLGSSEVAANLLPRNADGSLTLWFGPALPAGAPASKWIPTPSAAYYGTLYPEAVSTQFQLTLRMYYPAPSDSPPSILKCTVCTPPLAKSYIPPVVELVQ